MTSLNYILVLNFSAQGNLPILALQVQCQKLRAVMMKREDLGDRNLRGGKEKSTSQNRSGLRVIMKSMMGLYPFLDFLGKLEKLIMFRSSCISDLSLHQHLRYIFSSSLRLEVFIFVFCSLGNF